MQWGPLLGLTLIWVLLWGELTVGNALAGAALATLILVVFPLPPLAVGLTVRPVATLVLFGRFAYDVLVASVQVAWLAVRPGHTPRGVVVDLRLRSRNELFQTVTAEMVALVPGTVVIDLDSPNGVLTLHALDVSTRAEAERVRRHVLAQEARVIRAFDRDPGAVLDPRRRREASVDPDGGPP